MDKPVGFLGGTGIEGKGLALRFALAGVPVVIGSRSEERARSAAQEYNTFLGKPLLRGMVNRDMLASAGIVFLTVPADHAVAGVEACRDDFPSGLILVDVTVPTQIKEGRVEYLERKEGSNAELIAAHLPDRVRLVGAFKTVPAHVLAELDTPLECDVFVCSDSKEARGEVMEVAKRIPSLRPLDAGPLGMARTLERMTILAIHLNRRYKKKGARYSVVGI